MSDDTVKLLQDRVREAVARIRSLRAERDGRVAECDALRARVGELEGSGHPVGLERARSVLRDAIRELREIGGPDDETGPRRNG